MNHIEQLTTLTRIKKKRVIKILIPIILIGFIIFRLIFEKDMIQYKSYEIESTNLPAALENFKIIHLTDTHFRSSTNYGMMADIVERVNIEEADLIVLTGDYVEKGTDYIDDALDMISQLEAKYGIYAVLGNHDGWGRYPLLYKGLSDIGVHVLENAYELIDVNGSQIYICGVEDMDTRFADIKAATIEASDEDFVIMLSHNPMVVNDLKDAPVDLMFSGHTHGGQITLLGLYAPILPGDIDQKLASGHSKIGDTDIIVSNGIGTTFTNIRFFARPQVVITTLTTSK